MAAITPLILRQTTIAGGARLAESAYRVLPWAGRTAFPFPAFPTPSPTSRARGTAPLSTAASCTGRVVHRTDDPYTTRGSTGEIRPRAHPCVWAPIPTSTAADAGQTSGPECDGGGGGPAAALSVEQVQQFSIHGFLVVEDVFSEADLAPVHAELAAFHDKADHATRITDKSLLVTEEDTDEHSPAGHVLRSIFSVHRPEVAAATAALCASPRLVESARQLLASDVYIHQSRVNFQAPFTGKGFYWHSDFETWHAEDGMAVPRAVSCVVMLEDNHAHNGALMVVPGSHMHFISCVGATPEANWETSLKAQQYIGVPSHQQIQDVVKQCAMDLGIPPADSVQYATGRRGSVLIFDCNLLHGSHSNIGPFGRCNIFQVFNATSNKLQAPFHAPAPRPEHIAARIHTDTVLVASNLHS